MPARAGLSTSLASDSNSVVLLRLGLRRDALPEGVLQVVIRPVLLRERLGTHPASLRLAVPGRAVFGLVVVVVLLVTSFFASSFDFRRDALAERVHEVVVRPVLRAERLNPH